MNREIVEYLLQNLGYEYDTSESEESVSFSFELVLVIFLFKNNEWENLESLEDSLYASKRHQEREVELE